VHRPPKTADSGGQRYGKIFKKWAKIDLLRITQHWYQTTGFDLYKQDLELKDPKILQIEAFDL
jgi:hypothetical protein